MSRRPFGAYPAPAAAVGRCCDGQPVHHGVRPAPASSPGGAPSPTLCARPPATAPGFYDLSTLETALGYLPRQRCPLIDIRALDPARLPADNVFAVTARFRTGRLRTGESRSWRNRSRARWGRSATPGSSSSSVCGSLWCWHSASARRAGEWDSGSGKTIEEAQMTTLIARRAGLSIPACPSAPACPAETRQAQPPEVRRARSDLPEGKGPDRGGRAAARGGAAGRRAPLAFRRAGSSVGRATDF